MLALHKGKVLGHLFLISASRVPAECKWAAELPACPDLLFFLCCAESECLKVIPVVQPVLLDRDITFQFVTLQVCKAHETFMMSRKNSFT